MQPAINIMHAQTIATAFITHTNETEIMSNIQFQEYIKAHYPNINIINVEWQDKGWDIEFKTISPLSNQEILRIAQL